MMVMMMVIVLMAVEVTRDSADSGMASAWLASRQPRAPIWPLRRRGCTFKSALRGRRLGGRGRVRRFGMQVAGSSSRPKGRLPRKYLYEFHDKFARCAVVM